MCVRVCCVCGFVCLGVGAWSTCVVVATVEGALARHTRTHRHTPTHTKHTHQTHACRFSAPSVAGNLSRRWRDGSLELDLPTFLLSEMFNCNHFIVSQTNPHIVPLLNLKKSLSRRWANLLELELRHRCEGARGGWMAWMDGARGGWMVCVVSCCASSCVHVRLAVLTLFWWPLPADCCPHPRAQT